MLEMMSYAKQQAVWTNRFTVQANKPDDSVDKSRI